MLITTHTAADYKIKYNGKQTWLVVDNHGDVYDARETERKAINLLKKVLKTANVQAEIKKVLTNTRNQDHVFI